jgi:hypothetical protein
MKKLGLLIASIIISCGIFAQESPTTIQWDKTKHDFGAFKEEAGKQTATFTFTNTGTEPIVVSAVRPSCGCTAADYTKEPVQPGGKGHVKATYDPANRSSGKFDKSVTVTTNANPSVTILRIEGDATPREKTTSELYPREFGNLRLKSSHVSLSKVLNTQTKKETIEVINSGTEDVDITFENVPAHISVKAIPQKLKGMKDGEKHGEKGIIELSYDGTKKNDWGVSTDRFYVIINGAKDNKNSISVSATLEEDFSYMSGEERAQAPKIEFSELEHDFGTIKQGEKAIHNYTFVNTGKSDLVIRKIRTTCGCTATNPEKMVIKPGETSHITVTYNSAGKRGKEQKTITVITNDPQQSSIALKIIGNVEEKTQ